MRTASRRRSALGTAALAATALTLAAACSPTIDASDEDTAASAATTVTFRLWDDVAAAAYQESFDAFSAQHPDIRVDVEVVPRADYWERLPRDLSSGKMADIFWADTAHFARYADDGDLLDITAALGDDHDEWEQSVVDLYTRDGTLWGVPQLWESIALYYNRDLVEAAGVDPTALTWGPPSGEGEQVGTDDTLLTAARALTTDAAGRHPGDAGFDAAAIQTFGIDAQADPQAVYPDFLAENGAQFQDGDEFAFATPEGEQAFQYLVDLINTHHVAPPAGDTSTNGDLTRDLFLQGRLGLFQSGPHNLREIADNADLRWGLAPMVAGPEGRVSVVDGVSAVGNAHTDSVEATTEVLRWLGSTDGQSALASQGVAFPAAVDAQRTYLNYWADRDVDVRAFVDAVRGPTAPAPTGPDVNAGIGALTPILQDMFLGIIPVPEALKQAQEAGNAALAK
jgi:multiple sugar transport system substrate-binding protein